MTLDTLRSARHVIVAANGADKTEAVVCVGGEPDPATPARLLGDSLTELVLNDAAGSRLSHTSRAALHGGARRLIAIGGSPPR